MWAGRQGGDAREQTHERTLVFFNKSKSHLTNPPLRLQKRKELAAAAAAKREKELLLQKRRQEAARKAALKRAQAAKAEYTLRMQVQTDRTCKRVLLALL